MPIHGSVTIVNGAVLYTAQPNYSGSDSFTYTVKDNAGLVSNVATVFLTVLNSNKAPSAEDQSFTLFKNTHKLIVLKGSDPEGDTLTYSIVRKPSYGILSSIRTDVLYVPNVDFVGKDSFTFKVSDSLADSNIATVSIEVKDVIVPTPTVAPTPTPTPTPVPDAPIAVNISNITDHSALLSWEDVSDDELYSVVYVNGKAVVALRANETSYQLTNLSAKTRYVCYVKVYSEKMISSSEELIFTTSNYGWLPAIYHILNFETKGN